MPKTPEEFAKEMAEIASELDTEHRHAMADCFMCELLTELGYGEGIKIFSEMVKWYA